MKMIQDLIERKIEESIAKGEFDNLPGMGKPLDLKDDSFVPDDLRMAYRVLQNAGVKPVEVEMKIELEQLRKRYLEDTSLDESQKAELKSRILEKETQFLMAIERMQRTSRK